MTSDGTLQELNGLFDSPVLQFIFSKLYEYPHPLAGLGYLLFEQLDFC
jgi:hypothetical protein